MTQVGPGGGSTFCDMGLDVVMYTVGNLAVEADILSFDPYKATGWGFPNKSSTASFHRARSA
jgi:hypothetical protein